MHAASEIGLELIVVEKDGCHLTADRDGSLGPFQSESCNRWNDDAVDVIKQLEPDFVFTLGSIIRDAPDYTPEGARVVWQELNDAGITVVAIRDTPALSEDPLVCLERTTFDSVQCGVSRESVFSASFDPEAEMYGGVKGIDMSDAFCVDAYCPSVIGEVIVYRDTHHVTAAYVSSLAPVFTERLREALGDRTGR